MSKRIEMRTLVEAQYILEKTQRFGQRPNILASRKLQYTMTLQNGLKTLTQSCIKKLLNF